MAGEYDYLRPKEAEPKGEYDYLRQVNTPMGDTPKPDGSWWQQHGRTVEKAALGGITLLAAARAGPAALSRMAQSEAPLAQTAARGVRAVQGVFAPSRAGEAGGRAAETIRQATGEAARGIASAEARFEPLWKDIGAKTPEQQRNFISYVEGRSKDAQLYDPNLQTLADEIRDQMASVHRDLGNLSYTQKRGFIEDYYRHQWKVNPDSEKAFSKAGQGHFLKERSIPTIEAGMAKGLIPKTLDPVQTSLEYIKNARNFIATNKVIDVGRRTGDIFYRPLGFKGTFPTNDRWIPLEGSLAKRGAGQLYAKEDWARVFNNYISLGFTGAAGDVINGARRISNSMTALELGLSGYHATTMVNEAVINDIANSIMSFSKGKGLEGIQKLLGAPTAPYRLFKSGKKLESVYLGETGGTAAERKMADLLTKAGGRAQRSLYAKDYEYTAMGSFWRSFKKGALPSEMKAYGEQIRKNPIPGAAKTITSLVGRTMQSIMEPLFQGYIPRLKVGAFQDNMALWLKHNPVASEVDQIREAQKIWDSVDNRFGELVQDNIFWRNHLKQVSMIAMRSYSWNVGTVRELAGGALDIGKGQMSQRAAYVIALPIAYATIGAIYQTLKTGQKPQDMQDLIAPKTGGTDPSTGLPERLKMPGYMKDVFGWYDDPLQTAMNKMGAAPSTLTGMVTGKDWRGDPISPPAADPGAPLEQTAPDWLKAYFNFAGQKVVPISLQQRAMRGTGISGAERLLGLQPAGRQYVDPEGYTAMRERAKQKTWRSKMRHDIIEKSKYEED